MKKYKKLTYIFIAITILFLILGFIIIYVINSSKNMTCDKNCNNEITMQAKNECNQYCDDNRNEKHKKQFLWLIPAGISFIIVIILFILYNNNNKENSYVIGNLSYDTDHIMDTKLLLAQHKINEI